VPLHRSTKAAIKGLLISWIFADDPVHQELLRWAFLTAPKLLLKQPMLAANLTNTNLLDLFQSQRVGWIRQGARFSRTNVQEKATCSQPGVCLDLEGVAW
jgi:hypothetical protein